MNFVALKMFLSDRAKYFGLIFAIAFASFLLATLPNISRWVQRIEALPNYQRTYPTALETSRITNGDGSIVSSMAKNGEGSRVFRQNFADQRLHCRFWVLPNDYVMTQVICSTKVNVGTTVKQTNTRAERI